VSVSLIGLWRASTCVCDVPKRQVDDAPLSRQDGGVLICAECSREADYNATGWQAHLGADDIDEIADFEEPRRVLAFVFCPACAEREFGKSARVRPTDDGALVWSIRKRPAGLGSRRTSRASSAEADRSREGRDARVPSFA
jgi:hypothetical protein